MTQQLFEIILGNLIFLLRHSYIVESGVICLSYVGSVDVPLLYLLFDVASILVSTYIFVFLC